MAPTNFEDFPSSAGARYAIRGELDGTWSVYEVSTGLPAVYEEQMLVNLTFDLADVMLEHLSEVAAGMADRGPWGAHPK